MIGTTLSHFKIIAKLGEGGMGEVYRAEDLELKREVVIDRMSFIPEVSSDGKTLVVARGELSRDVVLIENLQ